MYGKCKKNKIYFKKNLVWEYCNLFVVGFWLY